MSKPNILKDARVSKLPNDQLSAVCLIKSSTRDRKLELKQEADGAQLSSRLLPNFKAMR